MHSDAAIPALLLFLSTMGLPSPAWAQPADAGAPGAPGASVPEPVAPEPAAEPTAAALLAQGRAALAAGELGKACKLLRAAHDKSPGEDVLFEVAECHEKAGDEAAAVAAYRQVAALNGARAAEAAKRAGALSARAAAPAAPPKEPPAAVEPGATPAAVPMPLSPPPTRDARRYVPFSPFMDTRLTWTFGDDDVIHAPGQTTPLSPDAAIGDRKKYRLFFDNLNSQFAGRENLTHLVIYKKMPGFIDRLDTEASMVLRFDLGALSQNTNNIDGSLYDAGSFIRLFYRTGDDDKTGLGLTLWPLDTDRFRLGYLYDISWGGTNARYNQSIFPRIQGSAPGGKIQFSTETWKLYFGLKTAQIVQVEYIPTPGGEIEAVRIANTNYGWLGGAGATIGDYLSVDAGGGYFQQGKFDLPDVLGERVFTFGGSLRLAVHSKGSGVKDSADFALYRNDPMKHERLLAKSKYTAGDTSWSITAEGTNLWQNLKDFDVPGQTRLQTALAAALQGNIQHGYLRASLTGIFRDLPYVLRNVPSFVPFETLPSAQEAQTGNELFVAAATDYHFSGPRLTPGIGAGLQFPATFKTSQIDKAGGTIGRTVVVRQQGDNSILPTNRNAVPIFQARASLRWDISEILSAVAWVQFVRDNNGTFVERDPVEATLVERQFQTPNFLGFGTSVQARF